MMWLICHCSFQSEEAKKYKGIDFTAKSVSISLLRNKLHFSVVHQSIRTMSVVQSK